MKIIAREVLPDILFVSCDIAIRILIQFGGVIPKFTSGTPKLATKRFKFIPSEFQPYCITDCAQHECVFKQINVILG